MVGITKKTIAAAKRAERDALGRFTPSPRSRSGKTRDSYQNFALNLGLGTDNALSGSSYGFNPISRNRTLLEWIHRGSWIGGLAVDVVADDVARAGIDIVCDAPPEDIQGVQDCLVRTGTWEGVRDTFAWGRLYGGAIGVIMIDGQDYEKPLEPKRIGKGQFRGVVALDRWMVEPSLSDLVAEQGPYLGLPKYYRVTSDIPGLRNKIIHYTRCIRVEGIRLPYWQRVSENLWGISVLERLYDRMIAFDSATQGAAQLAYKSYLRTIKIKGLREILAAGGPAEAVLVQYVDMMRRFQSIEGMTILDADDEFEPGNAINMAGMSDALLQFGQQLSGALQIPLVRMFGQSPAGLNSTGESDLRTYYDGINQQQKRTLMVPMHVIVRAASLSEGRKIPDDYQIIFRPLWQLSEEQKSEVASRDTETTLKAEERGVVSQQTALKELKQQSKVTGRWSNVTDEDVEAASDEIAPRGEEAIQQEQEAMEHRASVTGGGDDENKNDPRDTKDRAGWRDAAGKWSKTAVHYGPGRWPTVCGNCQHFLPETGCELVLGTVSFAGWCDQFSVAAPRSTQDASTELEKARKNYLAKSDLLTISNAEIRALTTNKSKTKSDVNAAYDKHDKVKRDFEAARAELDKIERSVTRDSVERSSEAATLDAGPGTLTEMHAEAIKKSEAGDAPTAKREMPDGGTLYYSIRPRQGNSRGASRGAHERAEINYKAKGQQYSKQISREKAVQILAGVSTRDSLPISEVHGIPVAIETLRGTIRRGTDPETGKDWESVSPEDYGYVRRAPSAEGPTEWLDCFIGRDRENKDVHVVDGYEPLGRFDEHKVLFCFSSQTDALRCFHDAYNDGRRAGAITTMTVDEFNQWRTSADMTKPISPRNLRLAANGQP